jgi:threonine dehydrogenase-like Zn-dependent dehydrogenase
MISDRGRICDLGWFNAPIKVNLQTLQWKEAVILTSFACSHQDLLQALGLIVEAKIILKPLITHKFPISMIQEAFKTALLKEKTKAIKVEIIF